MLICIIVIHLTLVRLPYFYVIIKKNKRNRNDFFNEFLIEKKILNIK